MATAPVKIAIERLAQGHAHTALKALADIALNGESEAARVSAAVALLDRGFGKPRQTVEADVRVKDVREMSLGEISAELAALGASDAGEETADGAEQPDILH